MQNKAQKSCVVILIEAACAITQSVHMYIISMFLTGVKYPSCHFKITNEYIFCRVQPTAIFENQMPEIKTSC